MVHRLLKVCAVGGNAISAFLSWRLQATTSCDVTLVWKSGFDAVAQYGVSFKYVCGRLVLQNMVNILADPKHSVMSDSNLDMVRVPHFSDPEPTRLTSGF